MKLDFKDPVPLHIQLKKILKAEILARKYSDQIPSEKELMSIFGVSRATVREAIGLLVKEGVLEKKRGIGTFVCHSPVIQWLGTITRYHEVIEEMGMKPGTRLLFKGVVNSPKEVGEALSLEEFYCITRLRMADDIPIVLERHYYSLDIGLRLGEFDLNQGAIYDLMETELGITLWRAKQQILAGLPSKEEAKLLQIPKRQCALLVNRLTYSPEDKMVEYFNAVYRSDLYGFMINLDRRHD